MLTALALPTAKTRALLKGEEVAYERDGEFYLLAPYYPFLLLSALPIGVLSQWTVALVARYREYVADRSAVAMTGDPAALASALETLDSELSLRPTSDLRGNRSTAAFSIVPPPWEEHPFFDRARYFIRRRLFGTHPPTAKRIERLRTYV